ncbi:MAG: phosphotransferase [Actinomycetaceae bacterium]|nr:phosphotransferase [Actinomycetaceae bacterium]
MTTVPEIPHRTVIEYMAGPGASALVHAACHTSAPAPLLSRQGYQYRLADLAVASWTVGATHARPGAGVSVTYRVRLMRGHDTVSVQAVASTERLPRGAATALRLDPGTIDNRFQGLPPIPVYVWVFPADPLLPQLSWAYSTETISNYFGIASPTLTPVVYRPTRRAMIRVKEGSTIYAWIKVLPADKAAELQRILATLEGSNFPIAPPVPVVLPGLVIQRHGKGRPLSNVISKEPHHAARMFGQISQILDALPDSVLALPRQRSWTDRRVHYAESIASTLPDLQPATIRLLRIIDTYLDESLPLVPTHGDLFEANLLTDARNITTVLDLDSIGPGRRADDYACLLAHISVLPFLAPRRWITAEPTEPWRHRLNQFLAGKRCPSYPESETVLEAWRIQAEREVNPADLYARTAAVTLSLAASASLMWGESEMRARFARAMWWADLADEIG